MSDSIPTTGKGGRPHGGRLFVVSAPSGAGKTSFLQACAIPSAAPGWAVEPAPDRSPTVGNEYVDQPARVGGGIALPTRDLGRMLGNDLLDNRAATAVSTYSFLLPASEAAAGPAVLFRFRQEPVSRGYWGPGANGRSAYTIDNVAFEILPRAVEVTKGASSVQSDDIPEVD